MTKTNISFFILLFVSFIYVPLSMVSGLALAPLLVILGVFSFLNATYKFKFLAKIFQSNYNTYLLLLFLFAIFTSFSSVNIEYSFISLAKITAILLCGFAALYNNMDLDDYYKRILAIIFVGGYSVGIIIMSTELLSDGILTKALRFLINQKDYLVYKPESLNRGACILAISFWILVLALHYLKPKRYILITASYWLIVMLLLMLQESSSAKLSFIISSFLFLFFILLKCKYMKLYIIIFLLFLMLFPVFFLLMPAKVIYEEYPNMPDSMVHRMVIWNFSMSRMSEKYNIGWGFNASRYIPGALDPVYAIIDEQKTWKRLPNHSHNLVIQTGLELGFFGALLLLAYIATFMHFIRINEKDIFRKSIIITVITSYIIIGFFAFSAWQEWWLSTAFIIAVLYSSIADKKDKKI